MMIFDGKQKAEKKKNEKNAKIIAELIKICCVLLIGF